MRSRWLLLAIVGACALVLVIPIVLSADFESADSEPSPPPTSPPAEEGADAEGAAPPADAEEDDGSAAIDPDESPTAAADPAPPPRLEVGVALDEVRDVETWIETVGVIPDVVDVYAAWHDVPEFDQEGADLLDELGVTKKITWEPWVADTGVDQPAYALATIAAGDHDRFLRRWAQAMVEHDRPVVLRPMHEMNGGWYPWGAEVNGNSAGDFVAAWRHLREVFDDEGADKVVWEWAPNQLFDGTAPLEPLYPGDAYVDRIGISAYNWGEDYAAYHRWRDVPTLFDDTVAAIRSFTSVPIGVAESASSSEGGDKATWIEALFEYALEEEFAFLTYFDLDTHRDWRLDHEETYVEAFVEGFEATRVDRPAIHRR